VPHNVSVRAAAATLPRIGVEEWRASGLLARWLIVSRAPLLVLTIGSATVGGLLALLSRPTDSIAWLACTVGLVLAHAASNQFNDLIDARRGIDRGDYFRLRYGAHPLEHRLLSPRQLLVSSAMTGVAALAIGLYASARTASAVGWPLAFGAVLLLTYTHPLKRWGLGEPTVLVVWGPLMTGGTYLVATGSWDWWATAIGTAFALGPTTVVFGKHIDKLPFDRERGVRTLPVRLGERAARHGVVMLLTLQYVSVVALVIAQRLPWPVLLCGAALPSAYRMWCTYRNPAPQHCPPDYPATVWPLWYSAFAFLHARRFAALFIAGLLLAWAVASYGAG
jgi:1,4-dihydroxy-2-naphthoate octaprenyltransferase